MVATPIGNLEDITIRALRVLREVDVIACEDTRHTRKLLNHFHITTPTVSYFRERERQRASGLVERLQNGVDIALVSDAGTPGVSDPGAVLVSAVLKAGISLVPVPGPSALSAALSVAGLGEKPVLFLGFPPSKRSERRRLFQSLSSLPATLVLYEAPHRIRATVRDLAARLGDRECLFLRELTKIHEEIRQTSLLSLAGMLAAGRIKGEIVLLVLAGNNVEQPDAEDLDGILNWYRDRDMTLKEAARTVSRDLGLPRTTVYRRALEVWHHDTDFPR